MARKNKVRAYIIPDPKSPLYGRAWFDYRIVAEGASFRLTSIVRARNLADAEHKFRKANKRFRHEVRMVGGNANEWPITVERA